MPDGTAVRYDDRLLAEAVRALEHDGRQPIREPAADARATEGDLERRIVTRAAALSVAPALRSSLKQLRQVTLVAVAGIVLLGLVAGAGAARAILDADRDRPVNFFWALGGAVGVQSALLVVWALLMTLRPRALAAASLGGVALAAGRWLASRTQRGAEHAAALEANAQCGGALRWLLGSISHGAWLAFNAGCLGLVILLLSTHHYTFTWETTILTDDAYRTLTHVVAAGPRLLGFPSPTPEQIAAAQWPPDPAAAEAARTAWSWLLVGCIVVYGLAPRALLLALCVWRHGAAARRWRLDTTRPGYLRLRGALMPASTRLGVTDPAEPDRFGAPPEAADEAVVATGPPAFLGLEIEPPASRWPPVGGNVSDLGLVDDGEGRRDVLERLAQMDSKPRRLVVVCSLTTTPDRGHRSFLRELRRSAGRGVSLALTGGEALRRRDRALVETRVGDWRRLAGAAGLEPDQVAEADLDHLTDATRAALAALAGGETAPPAARRRVEEAFDLIAGRAARWTGAPDEREQAELHLALAQLYRAEHAGWRTLLGAPHGLAGDVAGTLRGGAERVVGLLPPRLKSSARWLAAGAVAGALGCVAAAALVSPVAISALPVWSGLGAGLAAAIRVATGGQRERLPADDAAAPGEAVRAATLFALVLELQGRGEAAITRILDKALGADEGEEIDDVRSFLDGVRHRLDLALGEESSP